MSFTFPTAFDTGRLTSTSSFAGVLPERSLKQFSEHFRGASPLPHKVRMQGALFFGRLAFGFLKQYPLLTDCY